VLIYDPIRVVKKYLFTLFELLIVLSILLIAVSVMGVRLSKYYQEQRFLSECQQIKSQFTFAQDLMLIMNADVQVKLAHDEKTKKVVCWLEVEKPLKPEQEYLIERKLSLSAIHSYQFEGDYSNPLILPFTLGSMKRGTLLLSEAHQNAVQDQKYRQMKIELVGYPCPVGAPIPSDQRVTSLDQTQIKIQKSQLLYPLKTDEK
jgi:type II secretory pathway pseudopilin PulG